jgi:hypothetical protein
VFLRHSPHFIKVPTKKIKNRLDYLIKQAEKAEDTRTSNGSGSESSSSSGSDSDSDDRSGRKRSRTSSSKRSSSKRSGSKHSKRRRDSSSSGEDEPVKKKHKPDKHPSGSSGLCFLFASVVRTSSISFG